MLDLRSVEMTVDRMAWESKVKPTVYEKASDWRIANQTALSMIPGLVKGDQCQLLKVLQWIR